MHCCNPDSRNLCKTQTVVHLIPIRSVWFFDAMQIFETNIVAAATVIKYSQDDKKHHIYKLIENNIFLNFKMHAHRKLER